MNRFLRIIAKARTDIDCIFDWLEKRSPQGAATWYDALFETVGKIAEKPESYPLVAEMLPSWNRQIHQALFKTPHGKRYRIVFELTETEIQILRVRGPGQRPLRGSDLPKE